jgi:hypothetical protein
MLVGQICNILPMLDLLGKHVASLYCTVGYICHPLNFAVGRMRNILHCAVGQICNTLPILVGQICSTLHFTGGQIGKILTSMLDT